MVLTTRSPGQPQTTIRVGNAGFSGGYPKLESGCQQGQRPRVDAQLQPMRADKAAQVGR
jgi:hypothetical protein